MEYYSVIKMNEKVPFAANWMQLEIIILTEVGHGTPLQYSCLENPMGRGAWWAAVHRVAKSRTRLSNSTFTFHFGNHKLVSYVCESVSVL